MQIDIETVRRCVTKHHGGFEDQSNEVLLAHWGNLEEETRAEYLAEDSGGAGSGIRDQRDRGPEDQSATGPQRAQRKRRAGTSST